MIGLKQLCDYHGTSKQSALFQHSIVTILKDLFIATAPGKMERKILPEGRRNVKQMQREIKPIIPTQIGRQVGKQVGRQVGRQAGTHLSDDETQTKIGGETDKKKDTLTRKKPKACQGTLRKALQ